MFRNSLLLFFAFLAIVPLTATAQQTSTYWIDQAGALGDDGAHACAQDGKGNVYVGGYFSGIVNFGGVTLSSKGTSDGYVAKYSISGALLWAKQLDGRYNGIINSLAVDNRGSVYAAGNISDSITTTDMVAVKFAADGTRKWTTRSRKSDEEYTENAVANGIAVSPDGNSVYLVGADLQDSLFFPPAKAQAVGGKSGLATICFDSNGVARWIRVTHNSFKMEWFSLYTNAAFSCTTDDSGNVYTVGAFSDTLNSEGVRLLGNPSGYLPIIISYDSNGTQRWVKPFPSLGSKAISITYVANRLYVTGDAALVCKFEPDGSIDGTLINNGKHLGAGAIASDKLGRIYLMGGVSTALKLDSLFVSNLGGPIFFVLRIDSLLKPIWVNTLRSYGGLRSYAITADSFGHRFIAGTASDTVAFGGLVSGADGNLPDGFVTYFLERDLTIKPLSRVDYCQLDTIVVPFEVRGGFYLANTFYLQISDSLGRFFSPPTLAELYSNTSGEIHAFLPPGLHSGTKYRIRVQASNPGFVSSDNGTDIIVRSSPKVSVFPSTSVVLCELDTVALWASGGVAYRWSTGETTSSIRVTSGGDYSVYVLGANGCGLPVTIRVTESLVPPIPAITRQDNVLRSSATTGNQWFKDGHVIAGAESQEYTATTSGLYWVSVSNAAGCSSVSDSLLVDFGDLSVQKQSSAASLVLTQVSSTELLISSGQSGTATVSLFDLLGRIVSSTSVNLDHGANTFELHSLLNGTLANGHYIIRVARDGSVAACSIDVMQ